MTAETMQDIQLSDLYQRAGSGLQVQQAFPDGAVCRQDCLQFLKALPDDSVDLIFADPPYNIKKAQWDDFASQEAYISWCESWIKECSRVLRSHGTLYVCGFSEILADLKRPAMQFFARCRWLVWYYDNKANLGKDWGRSHESILCLRKSKNFIFNLDDVRVPYNAHTLRYPQRAQGESSQFSQNASAVAATVNAGADTENKAAPGGHTGKIWQPNPLGAKPRDVIHLPTLCNGQAEKTCHPTQKPEALLRRLILAASDPQALVLDPFSGSGTTAVAARQLQRRFLVNDQDSAYNELAIARLQQVQTQDIAYWKEADRQAGQKRARHR